MDGEHVDLINRQIRLGMDSMNRHGFSTTDWTYLSIQDPASLFICQKCKHISTRPTTCCQNNDLQEKDLT